MFLSNVLTSLNDLDHLQEMQAIENYNCSTYAKDMRGKYIACNDYLVSIVGQTNRRDVLGYDDSQILQEHDAILVKMNDSAVRQAKQLIVFREPFFYQNKSMIATSIKAPLLSKYKKMIGIVGISIIQENLVADTHGLSERQVDCLYYLIKGKTIKQIAKALCLSNRTVEHYLETIKFKLGCASRTELIERAFSIPAIRQRLRLCQS